MPSPPPLVPVAVIGGYLGAGKTTLVNNALRQAAGRRLAVLVNDFGALPIDEDLIESRDGNVLGIAGGCVCCSYGSDLLEALASLGERMPRPDHILIETSGVALPGPVAASVTLVAGFAIDGIICVVDAETVRRLGRDRYLADTIERQLRDADLVILNKIDLVDDAERMATEAWIAARAPSARIVPARHAAVPIDLMVQGLRDASTASAPALLEFNAASHVAWASAAYELPLKVDLSALAQRLASPVLGVLRAKAIAVGLDGKLWTLQLVGARHVLAPAPQSVTESGRLVCIGLANRLDRALLDEAVAHSSRAPDEA